MLCLAVCVVGMFSPSKTYTHASHFVYHIIICFTPHKSTPSPAIILYVLCEHSRSPASPSWTDDLSPTSAAAASASSHQSTSAAGAQVVHKTGSIATGSYMDGSDTRSLSNDTMIDHQQQQHHHHHHHHHQAQHPPPPLHNGGGGGGGKLGYNNNQYLANAHLSGGHSSELLLSQLINDEDTVSRKHLSSDAKSDQTDFDQDGGGGMTETETKSVSSIKSGGSNPDARYVCDHIDVLSFFLCELFHIQIIFVCAHFTTFFFVIKISPMTFSERHKITHTLKRC